MVLGEGECGMAGYRLVYFDAARKWQHGWTCNIYKHVLCTSGHNGQHVDLRGETIMGVMHPRAQIEQALRDELGPRFPPPRPLSPVPAHVPWFTPSAATLAGFWQHNSPPLSPSHSHLQTGLRLLRPPRSAILAEYDRTIADIVGDEKDPQVYDFGNRSILADQLEKAKRADASSPLRSSAFSPVASKSKEDPDDFDDPEIVRILEEGQTFLIDALIKDMTVTYKTGDWLTRVLGRSPPPKKEVVVKYWSYFTRSHRIIQDMLSRDPLDQLKAQREDLTDKRYATYLCHNMSLPRMKDWYVSLIGEEDWTKYMTELEACAKWERDYLVGKV